MKKTLLLHLPPKAEAILYGSQARGDERPDSDWDILVIVDKDRLLPQDYDQLYGT
ncbi:MAG: nucleotidyltransferase domain-containing protein [Prevotella sp.]|nr:nucleotidyltransferase domain-containing protein [Prevotella sp.]